MAVIEATKIGFIGCGALARNLAVGFIQSGFVKKEHVIASDVAAEKMLTHEFQELGIRVTNKNADVIEASDVVCLNIKREDLRKVLEEVRPELRCDRTLIMSLAAGISIKNIEKMLPARSRVVRVIPSTCASTMARTCGTSVYACGRAMNQDDTALVDRLLSSIGACENVDETMIDAMNGISGSGPAYMFMVIESLVAGGVQYGIPRELAVKMAAQTMLGSAKMVLETKKHPAILRDAVCSPGGSSIAALGYLEKMSFRSMLMEAVRIAARKSSQIGHQKN